MTFAQIKPYLTRLLLILALSVLAVWLISEIGLRLQNENAARAPETVELLIPNGTAAQVEAGEDPPAIPDELAFVLGDVLLVRNQDVVAHTLGPLLIPPQSAASMPLDQADNFALSCSFKPTQYLGIDVNEPTTALTRLTALAFASPPTAVVLFVYSLVIYPIKSEDPEKPGAPKDGPASSPAQEDRS